MPLADLIFLDFEASSLDKASWPVEWGVAWIAGDEVSATSMLIKPHPDWPMSAWSPVSADIHGIDLETLKEAVPAEDAAQSLMDLIRGKTLVSDAPEYEARWLKRMVDLTGDDLPEIHDFDEIAARVCKGNDRALDHLYEKLERIKAPHRAAQDALRRARAVKHGYDILVQDPGTSPSAA